jgi:hypothetical protein
MIRRNLTLTISQLAWLAGLMEGEGSFSRATPAMPRRPRMSVNMTDRDVIERVCELWGTRLYTHIPKVERFKSVFRTELVGGSAVAMMALLRPHMGLRRQAQIDEAVVTYQPLRVIKHKRFQLLPHGHDEFDRCWLAGLLEGEAYFGLNAAARQTISPMVELNTVDHDVILRVQRIYAARYAVAVNLHVRPPRHAGYQPQYHLACYGDAARAVMGDIAPLMGERRRARIDELVGAYVQPRLIGEARAWYAWHRAAA